MNMNASPFQSAATARCAETREPWTPSRWNHLAFREAMAPETAFALGNRMHHLATTAYPVGHAQTFRPYRLGGTATGEAEALVHGIRLPEPPISPEIGEARVDPHAGPGGHEERPGTA